MADNRYIALEQRGVLQVTGPEAFTFLQGLITNDLQQAKDGQAVYAALLTPQGKYLHDFFIAPQEEGYLIDCDKIRMDDLLRRLNMYKLRAKVTLENLSDRFEVLAVLGNDVTRPRTGEDGIAFMDPRHPEMGARVIAKRGNRSAFAKALGLIETEGDDYERLRLSLGIPESGKDLMPEKSFPPQYNFDALNAISYEKGCYVGQEPIARAHYRGTLRKKLYRVKVEGILPPPGSEITTEDGKKAGKLLSGFEDQALAILQIEKAEAALDSNTPLLCNDTPLRIQS